MMLRVSVGRVRFSKYSDKVMSSLHRLIAPNRTHIPILKSIDYQLLSAMRLFQYNLLHSTLLVIRVNHFSKTIMPYAQFSDQKYTMQQDISHIESMFYYRTDETERQIFLQLHEKNINYVFLVISRMKFFVLFLQRKSKTLLEVN